MVVYCSNESNQDVFFDNLQVIQTRGPVLSEDHYYSFGLTMSGISSKAAGRLENKYKFNGGNELQHNEFSDGSGLEMYDAHHRMFDQQLGVFHQIDLLAEFAYNISPYVFSHDNPISLNDPLGLKDKEDTIHGSGGDATVYSSRKKVGSQQMNNMHYVEISVWVDGQRARGASPEQIQNWARNNIYLTDKTVDKILSASNLASIAIRDDQKIYWETQGKVYAYLLELLASEFGSEFLVEFSPELAKAYLQSKDFINEKSLQLWERGAVWLNQGKGNLAKALIGALGALGKYAPNGLIDRIQEWGNKFTDPAELGKKIITDWYEQIETVDKFIENIRQK